MPYDPLRHHRRSIRLKGYDYSQAGEYFVTLCVKDRERLLGEVVGGKVKLTEIGEIVREEWLRTPIVHPDVTLDEFVIMPDHLHGIVVISEERNGVLRRGELQFAPTRVLNDHVTPFRSPSKTLGAIIRGFNGAARSRINNMCGTQGGTFGNDRQEGHDPDGKRPDKKSRDKSG